MIQRLRHALLGTIRGQLIVGVALVHLVLMTLFVFDLVHRQQAFLLQRAETRAVKQAHLLATMAQSLVLTNDVAGLAAILGAVAEDVGTRFALVTDPAGHVLGHTDTAQLGKYRSDAKSLAVLRGKPRAYLVIAGSQTYEAAAPIVVQGHTLGWAWVGINISQDLRQIAYVTRAGLIYTLIAIFIGTVFAMLLARAITRPLRALMQGTRDLLETDKRRPLPVTSSNEIGVLTSAFNRAMAELDASDRSKRDALTLLDSLLANAPIGFAFFDETGRCRRANEFLGELRGRSAASLVGTSIDSVLPGASPELSETLAALARDQQVRTGLELTWTRGEEPGSRHLLASLYPVHTTEGGRWVGAVVADVTAQIEAQDALRRSEERLLQSQKLEAIGQLAGGVAHDFNNLLTVINGYASLGIDQLPAEDPTRDVLVEIRDAGIRAAALTSQLLAYSRKQVLVLRHLQLADVVADVGKLLARVIGEDIRLELVDDGSGAVVRVDGMQLEQVLLNFAVNARDAMPDGGILRIETATCHTDERVPDPASEAGDTIPAGDYAVLRCIDAGAGMTEEVRRHLFEPFFTTKAVGSGTGLGLATVYGIVRQSEGYIRVHSTPGQGATFEVWLPLAVAVVAADEPAPKETTARASGTVVLVVEDDPAVERLIRTVLEASGYVALSATDGADAMALLDARADVRLVICDLVMPHVGGREVVEAVRIRHPRLPVVLMSGYADDARLGAILADPEQRFLRKPFEPRDLLAAVQAALTDRSAGAANRVQTAGVPNEVPEPVRDATPIAPGRRDHSSQG